METMATTITPPPVFRLNSEILAEEGEEALSEDEYDYYGSSCCEHSSDREYYSHSDAPGGGDDHDDEEDNSETGTVINNKPVGRGPIFDKSQDLPSRIIAMAEFMFSDEHLCRDGFLLKHLRHRQDGYISLKLIASLRKVKRVCKDYAIVAEALKDSEKLEISPDGSKIRRKEPISPTLTVVKKPKKEGEENDEAEDGDSDDNPSKQGKEKRKRPQKKGKENKQQQQQQYGSGGDMRRNSNPRSRSGSMSMHQNLLWPGFDDHIMPRRRVASFSNTTSNPRANNNKQQNNQPNNNNNNNQRSHGNNTHYLSPNPTIAALAKDGGPDGFWRPKSNSYSEGSQGSKAGMSSWLEKRKASAASLKMSCGDISQNEVIRQPRGPDGTQGFHPQCRTLNPAMFTLVNHGVICPPPPLIMAH